MNQNIKLGFVKSKAFGLCGVILTAALMMGVSTVAYADEVTEPATEVVSSDAQAPTETQADVPEGPIATENLTAKEAVASTEAPAGNETPTISTATTEVTKEGDTITVKNPEVICISPKVKQEMEQENTTTLRLSTKISSFLTT